MNYRIVFVCLLVLSVIFSGCSYANQIQGSTQSTSTSTNTTSNTSKTKEENSNKNDDKINIDRYKYFDSVASFEYYHNNGYIYFECEVYEGDDSYVEKVRWNDDNDSKIVSASQVIAVDKKELYNEPLEIHHCPNDDVWNYYVQYKGKIRVKSSPNDSAECYVKMLDDRGIEYHVMLSYVDNFNVDGMGASAVYIIDKNENVEFWYDDYLVDEDDE